jgi:Flp pilus assembly pilin Flp
MSIYSWLRNLTRDEDAATAVEYAVLLAMILVAVMGAVTTLGAEAGGWWGGIDTRLSTEAWSN